MLHFNYTILGKPDLTNIFLNIAVTIQIVIPLNFFHLKTLILSKLHILMIMIYLFCSVTSLQIKQAYYSIEGVICN